MLFIHESQLCGFHVDVDQISLFFRKMKLNPFGVHIMVFYESRRLNLRKKIASQRNTLPGIGNGQNEKGEAQTEAEKEITAF